MPNHWMPIFSGWQKGNAKSARPRKQRRRPNEKAGLDNATSTVRAANEQEFSRHASASLAATKTKIVAATAATNRTEAKLRCRHLIESACAPGLQPSAHKRAIAQITMP